MTPISSCSQQKKTAGIDQAVAAITTMMTALLDVIPLWAMFLAFGTLLYLAVEGGYRLGRWRRSRVSDEKSSRLVQWWRRCLALFALVLGFTFNMAASRFDARRTAVLEEANAIGTTYLRASLLPEPQRTEVAKLLREYAAVRVGGIQAENTEQAIARSEALHEMLWSQATASAESNPSSFMTGLFVQSLNEVIDLHAKRVLVGTRSRIPAVIWFGLFGLAMLGMAAVGYQACALSYAALAGHAGFSLNLCRRVAAHRRSRPRARRVAARKSAVAYRSTKIDAADATRTIEAVGANACVRDRDHASGAAQLAQTAISRHSSFLSSPAFDCNDVRNPVSIFVRIVTATWLCLVAAAACMSQESFLADRAIDANGDGGLTESNSDGTKPETNRPPTTTTFRLRGRIDADAIGTVQSAANEATFGDLGDAVGLAERGLEPKGTLRSVAVISRRSTWHPAVSSCATCSSAWAKCKTGVNSAGAFSRTV